MTISEQGLLVATIRNSLAGGTATSLIDAGNKIAFYGDSLVPDFAQAAPVIGSAPWNTGEATGIGLPAGGVLLTGAALAHTSGGVIKWSADNVSVPSTTVSGITGMVVYAPAQGNRVIAVIIAPGGPHETQDGTLAIEWDALGIADWDLVPTP